MLEYVAEATSILAIIFTVGVILSLMRKDKRKGKEEADLRDPLYTISKSGQHYMITPSGKTYLTQQQNDWNRVIYRQMLGGNQIPLPIGADVRLNRFINQEQKSDNSSKKESIRNLSPKSFYYLDEGQIADLYSQISELQPKQIETEEHRDKKKGVGSDMKVIKSDYETGEESNTKKTYQIEITSAVKYNNIEEYLFDKDSVTFGIEEFQFDEKPINEFKAMCQKMKSDFKFDVPDDLQSKFVREKINGFASDKKKQISSTSGYIAIQGECQVKVAAGNGCELVYFHPLNNNLIDQSKKVSITVVCSNDCLTASGKNMFTNNNSINVVCLGKVVRWDEAKSCLVINPIGIY